jgi:hypothetical protein
VDGIAEASLLEKRSELLTLFGGFHFKGQPDCGRRPLVWKPTPGTRERFGLGSVVDNQEKPSALNINNGCLAWEKVDCTRANRLNDGKGLPSGLLE